MSNYNWCHGPECHEQQTQSRVRGSGTNKVLRTIKIKEGRFGGYQRESWTYFCNNRCLMDYIQKHVQSIVAIAPRRQAQESPIKLEEETYESTRWDFNSGIEGRPQRVPYMATRTTIKSVDND